VAHDQDAHREPDSISALRLSLRWRWWRRVNALVGIPIAYLARRRFWGKVSWIFSSRCPWSCRTVVGYYLIVLLGRRGVLERAALRPDRLDGGLHPVRR
jgi:ABC-type molybdate transport system permease subunit